VQATLLAEPEEEEHEFADADNADDGGDDARAEEDAHAFGSDDMAWEADQQHSTREPAPASATATTSSAGVCMITSAERREWEGYIDNEAKLARDMKREQREQFTAAEASDVTGNASEYARISAFTHEPTERRDALLEDLSDKQREVRDALYHAFIADGTGDQVLLMVAGEAGTGKSRAIDVIVLDALLQFGGAGQYGPVLVGGGEDQRRRAPRRRADRAQDVRHVQAHRVRERAEQIVHRASQPAPPRQGDRSGREEPGQLRRYRPHPRRVALRVSRDCRTVRWASLRPHRRLLPAADDIRDAAVPESQEPSEPDDARGVAVAD